MEIETHKHQQHVVEAPPAQGTSAPHAHHRNAIGTFLGHHKKVVDSIGRIAAGVLLATAAVLMAQAQEGQEFPLGILGTIYIVYLAIKYPALVYFIVVNGAVFVYTVASLILPIFLPKRNLELPIVLTDLIALGLLFTGGGAAAAITTSNDALKTILGDVVQLLDRFGVTALDKVLQGIDKFYAEVNSAISFSMIAAAVFGLLIVIKILIFHAAYRT